MNDTTTTTTIYVTHGQEVTMQAVFVALSFLYVPFIPAFLVLLGHMLRACAGASHQKWSTSIAHKYPLFLMPIAAEFVFVVRVTYYLLVAGKSFSARATGKVRVNGPELGVPPAGDLLWGISNVVSVLLFYTQVILWVQLYIEAKQRQRESALKWNIISGLCCSIVFVIMTGEYIYSAFRPSFVTGILVGVFVVGLDVGILVAGVLLLSRLRPKANNSATFIAHQKALYRNFLRFSILIFGVGFGFLVLLVMIAAWTLLFDRVTFFTFLLGSRICSFIIEWLVWLTSFIFLLLVVHKQKTKNGQAQQRHKSKGVPTNTTTPRGSEKPNDFVPEENTAYGAPMGTTTTATTTRDGKELG